MSGKSTEQVETEETTGFARRATASVAWTVSQQWVVRVTGFITVAILARTLSPADFGVVAAALSLLTFVYLLADMGFGTYLVQVEKPTPRASAPHSGTRMPPASC